MVVINFLKKTKKNVDDFSFDELSSEQKTKIKSSGLYSIALIMRLNDKRISIDQLKHQLGDIEEFGSLRLMNVLHEAGFQTKYTQLNWKQLNKLLPPLILRLSNGEYAILAKLLVNGAMIQLLGNERAIEISREELEKIWSGSAILVTPADEAKEVKFGLRWFFSTFLKYKSIVKETFLASAFIQIFALVSPLIFMVIIDKVFTHNSLSTLDVLMFALIIVSLFDVLLSGLRTYLMSHTSNRIDLELGMRLFKHMMSLPLNYFQSRRVGDTIARMQELETVRYFITGTGLTTLLDLFFVIIFIVVMFLFSPFLTLIVIAALPTFFLVAFIMTPLMRDRLDDKYVRSAENQSFLVETLSGIETLKSTANEPKTRRHWEDRLAAYTKASFSSHELANFTNNGISFVGKALTITLLWLGAKEVLAGNLSVGQLIAFNMLAVRVNAPVLRMAQIWQDFQGMQVSVKRLADILDTKPEPAYQVNRTLPDSIQGNIEFNQVSFQYQPDSADVLSDISFSINSGETVGIIGSSGSGKTTIAKLLQRLYVPSKGKVLIDGMDIATIDASWLRRQIGVVSQDCVLFNRSIRDNIALSDPSFNDASIIHAAQLAGIHDYILSLPDGYDTFVDERGANLSMGQRQRIALARAMISNPKLLILDEATSSLDYESEQLIQQNMEEICEGRTVFIIAHRFTTVRQVDRILTIENGQLIENDFPDKLLNLKGRFFELHTLHSENKKAFSNISVN